MFAHGSRIQPTRPPRIILLGFHRIASAIVFELERSHPELLPQTLGVDFNVAVHEAIRWRGIQVVYGNASNADTLRHAQAHLAQLLVSTVPDESLKNTANANLMRMLRELNPRATILAPASRPSQVASIVVAGADFCLVTAAQSAQGFLAALNAALSRLVAAQSEEHGRWAERQEILG